MAFSGSQISRLGLYGGPRGLYGAFSGKDAGQPRFAITLDGVAAGTIGVDGVAAGTMTLVGVAAGALALDGVAAGTLGLDGQAAGSIILDSNP